MNRTVVFFALAVLLAGIRPAAAIQVPQSRPEFVKAVATGARGAGSETFVVEQSFSTVYRLLEQKSSACLDVTVKRTAYVGYTEVSSSDYNPTLRKASDGRAEFSLQVVHFPRGIGEKTGPGGLYVMAADIRSLGNGRLEVAFYYPTIGYKKVVGAVKDWLQGRDAACPKMK